MWARYSLGFYFDCTLVLPLGGWWASIRRRVNAAYIAALRVLSRCWAPSSRLSVFCPSLVIVLVCVLHLPQSVGLFRLVFGIQAVRSAL